MKIYNKIKFIYIVFSCLFVLTLFSNNNFAQDEIIKVDTDLITVPVTVVDRDGRYITNLKKEDFHIFENGIEQKINFIDSIESSLTIFLLFDTSDSMSRQISEVASAANVFLRQLHPNNQIIIAGFDNRVDIFSEKTSVQEVRDNKKFRLRITPSIGDTMVYDAVEYALKKMKKFKGRKAIILFSDGSGSGYSASAKSNIRDAEENESLIYTLQSNTLPNDPPPGVNVKTYLKRIDIANEYMSKLAQVSGGRYFQIQNISNLETTFRMVADELGQQYSIGYYPKETGKKGERRQIKVKVNVPNAAVQARDNYIIGVKNKQGRKHDR